MRSLLEDLRLHPEVVALTALMLLLGAVERVAAPDSRAFGLMTVSHWEQQWSPCLSFDHDHD